VRQVLDDLWHFQIHLGAFALFHLGVLWNLL
jgi:hypothetical protein